MKAVSFWKPHGSLLELVTAEFDAEVRARPESNDWKMRACAGRVVRMVMTGNGGESVESARAYGLSRTLNAIERQAWLYGFEWEKGKEPRSLESLRAELERDYP